MTDKFNKGEYVRNISESDSSLYVVTRGNAGRTPDTVIRLKNLTTSQAYDFADYANEYMLDATAVLVVGSLAERGRALAVEAGYCSEYDRIAVDLGLKPADKKFRIPVATGYTVWVDVAGPTEEAARETARRLIQDSNMAPVRVAMADALIGVEAATSVSFSRTTTATEGWGL